MGRGEGATHGRWCRAQVKATATSGPVSITINRASGRTPVGVACDGSGPSEAACSQRPIPGQVPPCRGERQRRQRCVPPTTRCPARRIDGAVVIWNDSDPALPIREGAGLFLPGSSTRGVHTAGASQGSKTATAWADTGGGGSRPQPCSGTNFRTGRRPTTPTGGDSPPTVSACSYLTHLTPRGSGLSVAPHVVESTKIGGGGGFRTTMTLPP